MTLVFVQYEPLPGILRGLVNLGILLILVAMGAACEWFAKSLEFQYISVALSPETLGQYRSSPGEKIGLPVVGVILIYSILSIILWAVALLMGEPEVRWAWPSVWAIFAITSGIGLVIMRRCFRPVSSHHLADK
jgi:hypothetical protein